MIEINLLPWRQDVIKKQKKMKVIMVYSIISALLMLLGLYHFTKPPEKKREDTNKKIVQQVISQPKIKWKGYVDINNDFFGLVELQEGHTISVHAGSFIDKKNRVVRVDSSGMVVIINGKEERFGDVN